MQHFYALLTILILLTPNARAAAGTRSPGGDCPGALVRLDDARFGEASREHALLYDQLIKSAGSRAGGLITRLVYLGQSSPEIHDLLDRFQGKVKLLLDTPPGSTFVSVLGGLLVQVEDTFANRENQKSSEVPRDDDLLGLFLNGEYRVVGPDLIPDRGEDKDVVLMFDGIGIQTKAYKLKDRLTPPVAEYLGAAMMMLAISDPKALHEEYESYPDAMLMPLNDLAGLTDYMKAVVRTTGAGHFKDVNAAIEEITPSNAHEYETIALPLPKGE